MQQFAESIQARIEAATARLAEAQQHGDDYGIQVFSGEVEALVELCSANLGSVA